MKKNHQSKTAEVQESLLSRIGRVRNELNKLDLLISNDQQLNNGCIKKFLEEDQISSSSSERHTCVRDKPFLLFNEREDDSLEDLSAEIIPENQSYTKTVSKLSEIKDRDVDITTSKLQAGTVSPSFNQRLLQGAKQNKRTDDSREVKFSITKRAVKLPEGQGQLLKHHFLDLKTKQHLPTNKSLKCLNSGNRSKATVPPRKSSKEPVTPHLSRRKSGKLSGPGHNKTEQRSLFHDSNKFTQKHIQSVQSPKLNKINANKFRENTKKMVDSNSALGLAAKFHLNLAQHKSPMQRAIQASNSQKEYASQTRRFQQCVKQLSGSLVMEELDTDFKNRSESLKLLMVFLSQFSETIRKFFKNKAQNIQPKFQQLIEQTIHMLVKLPDRLHKNNCVSRIRYQSFMGSKVGVHKPSSKLQETVKCLREYMAFLFKSRLVEMTEGQIPNSGRSIVNYYSHRSTEEKIKANGKLSVDFRAKIGHKKYDTQRKSNNNSDHFDPTSFGLQKRPADAGEPKKVQSKVSPKHRLESAVSPGTKSRRIKQSANSSGLLSSISELKRRI